MTDALDTDDQVNYEGVWWNLRDAHAALGMGTRYSVWRSRQLSNYLPYIRSRTTRLPGAVRSSQESFIDRTGLKLLLGEHADAVAPATGIPLRYTDAIREIMHARDAVHWEGENYTLRGFMEKFAPLRHTDADIARFFEYDFDAINIE